VFTIPSSQSAFCSLAHASHAELVQALSALIRTSGLAQRRAGWQRVEDELLRHLRAEDELLLSDFDLALPAEATTIREHHQRIRQLIVQVIAAAKAGNVDAGLLKQLRACLVACSDHEERVLYPWADDCLRPRKKREFLQRG
jgi:hypothetical protein